MCRVDPTCILAAMLFFVGNCLLTVHWFVEAQIQRAGVSQYLHLDPPFLKDLWRFRRHWSVFGISAGLINASAWFVFTIPVMQLAWILSLGGKRGLSMHVAIVALVFGSAFTEFVAWLFYTGIMGVTAWVTKSFNLDDWESTGDGMGWRVVEINFMMAGGMILWVDAIEWLCMFGILTLIYFSSRNLMMSQTYRPSFTLGRCWAHLGLFIGMLSLIDFAANILSMSPAGFLLVYRVILIANRLFLLPLWLILFGHNLSKAATSSEIARQFNNPAGTTHANSSTSVPVFTPAEDQPSYPPVTGMESSPVPDQSAFPPIIGENDDLARSPNGPVD